MGGGDEVVRGALSAESLRGDSSGLCTLEVVATGGGGGRCPSRITGPLPGLTTAGGRVADGGGVELPPDPRFCGPFRSGMFPDPRNGDAAGVPPPEELSDPEAAGGFPRLGGGGRLLLLTGDRGEMEPELVGTETTPLAPMPRGEDDAARGDPPGPKPGSAGRLASSFNRISSARAA
jgi:hypothetical protein